MDSHEIKQRGKSLLTRFGVLGFLFFLLKGLAWVAVPGLLAYFGAH